MKKIFIFISALALFSSCSDEDFDINRDPDNLNNAPFSRQFPAGVAGVAGGQGAYYALIGGFWSQLWTQSNVSNQYKEIDDYSIGTLDYNAGWTAMYDALGDLRDIKRRAADQGNWNYYLMATTMEVHASQIMADFYDQIPYEEANNINFLQPRFQPGEEVYEQMIADLQEALSYDLSTSQGETPGSDDFLFGGNMANWTAFANTLLLKLHIRQTEVNPTLAQQGITALYNSGAQFLDTDAAMTQFENAPDRSNPLYETDRRQLNVQTNLRASRTTYSFLQENSDPRLDDFYGPGAPLNQGDFNSTVGGSSVSVVNLSAETPVYFLSREESLFLQAEALERYFGGAGAKELYDAAVVTAFSRWSENGSSFVAAGGAYEYPSGGDFETKLKAIITQKWLASFPGNGHEAFFEHNRTGYPEISPVPQTSESYQAGEWAYSVTGTTGGEFPKRLVFPENVRSRNQNAPDIIPNTVPVWWDVND